MCILFALGKSMRTVAMALERDHTTVLREVRRTSRYRGWYSAIDAEKLARKNRHKARRRTKLETNEKLRIIVYSKLKLRWSPEQIAHFLKDKYRGDTEMQISHESIYTHIYILPRGELRKELLAYLRQGSRGRKRRKTGRDNRGKIPNIVSIHERPAEVENRTVPGHWESDLLIGGKQTSAIGTLVERTTRTTILVPLRARDARSVRIAFARVVKRLPKEMCMSLTHDRGTEMYQHELFTKDTKVLVYFADPQSPWQRGTNENTNGLVRQFFPKGTDFSRVSTKEIKHVQKTLERTAEGGIGMANTQGNVWKIIG